MDIIDAEVDHDTIRISRRAADLRVFAEAQPHVAPAEGDKMWPYRVRRELQRIPIEGEQPVQILGPDNDPNEAVDHADISAL